MLLTRHAEPLVLRSSASFHASRRDSSGDLTTCRGFTLTELLLVLAMLGILLALLWPALSAARESARAATCSSNLRQIGMAYQLYVADNGHYPRPDEIAQSQYVPDRRILFCPDDTSSRLLGTASSYALRPWVPPAYGWIMQEATLDQATVLATCEHHASAPVPLTGGPGPQNPPPPEGIYLVLRAAGSVDRVPVRRVRWSRIPGPRARFMMSYPGEPGYEQARDW